MQHVHLIGIGGAGLSAIATVLLQQGYTVSGSDIQASENTERLINMGAVVSIGHQPENLDNTPDVVVVSSAIAPDNPELIEAQRRGIRVSKRAEWLGNMMTGKTGIAIAGTHGKTTTTAMTAFILQQAGQQPTFIVGGFIPQMNTGAAAGQGDAFVIEADEYDHTFLGLKPMVAVVTFAEWDHPDIYPTATELHTAFANFVQLVPPDGLVIGCSDAPGVSEVISPSRATIVTYGLETGCDWQAIDLESNDRGGYNFQLASRGQVIASVSLKVPGLHNVYNATAALVAADYQGVDLAQAAEIIGQFEGVGRRFELKGVANGIIIIDDYAHHPTEIRATLAAARTRFDRRSIWVVFQPHTFSRTLALLDDFLDAFDQADHVIIVDIYASREKDEGLISSREIVKRVDHPSVRYVGPLSDAADYLAARLNPGDVLITLGAGDGYRVGEWVLQQLRG